MSGYCDDYSMSNNARAAYHGGLVPASKIPGVPPVLVRAHVRPAEWHHVSKKYNRVDFFDPTEVRAVFGLASHPDYEADPAAIAALANHKRTAADAPTIHTGCRVTWLEWGGTARRPRATERTADGCTVSIRRQTATITLPGGTILTKRLDTRGFSWIVRTCP